MLERKILKSTKEERTIHDDTQRRDQA